MSQKTLLVTGGAGFIGANFVRYTHAHRPEYRIRVLDALTYAGNKENLAGLDDVDLVVGDICDHDLVDRLIADSDVVAHFAAESHVDNSLHDPAPFVRTNVHGTFTLLEAVRRHGKRLHHISTDEVFGDLPVDSTDLFTEDSPHNPSSPYSATKSGSDMLVRAWARSYGVQATISNCANNYGPYQHPEKFIPRQVTNLLTGTRPRLYGDGTNVREWTHVDDHNAAVYTIIDHGTPGETYLIGSADERSNREIVELILELLGHDTEAYDLVPDRPGHDLRYANDSAKLRALGWQPHYSDFRQGLADTIAWYQANQPWWQAQKTTTETKYTEIGR
ncbi:dTDP-glucose 4,6-dehydratase [Streptomyces sp. BE20]|uniref:dTDP-glucose 4,6-dehydratase n=1 Tax=Streptomyces sp. BE20 TaxID=3002525 RepID=UPI002E75C073|nr:dTDP-glucose 4,6-dehydratase [Streptomyces sp. BE20]MEE1820837.1 dTDP-glucose 4,6-dehydratase [Streptomyces sp. BE20]